jgi:hypothetical protein
LGFERFAIPDRGVPASLESADQLWNRLEAKLRDDRSVGIYCRASIGRAGLVAVRTAFRKTWPGNAPRQRAEDKCLIRTSSACGFQRRFAFHGDRLRPASLEVITPKEFVANAPTRNLTMTQNRFSKTREGSVPEFFRICSCKLLIQQIGSGAAASSLQRLASGCAGRTGEPVASGRHRQWCGGRHGGRDGAPEFA